MAANSYGTYKRNGIPISIGEDYTTGSQWFVDSTTGNDSNSGKDPEHPLATIDAAVNKCTANKMDRINVMPNHTEALTTAGITMDVAGVHLVGLGHGTNQPQVDFTGTAGKVVVSAADCKVKNINFHANVSAVVIGLDIQAGGDYCVVEDCVFDVETTTTDEFLISINVGVVSGSKILNNVIDNGLGGAAHGIKLVGASTGCDIIGNAIKGDYSTANVGGITTLSTEVLIQDNLLMNGGSGNVNTQPLIEMLTNTTGYVLGNDLFCNESDVASMCVADAMFFSRNYASEDVGAAAGSIITTAATSVTAMADDT